MEFETNGLIKNHFLKIQKIDFFKKCHFGAQCYHQT